MKESQNRKSDPAFPTRCEVRRSLLPASAHRNFSMMKFRRIILRSFLPLVCLSLLTCTLVAQGEKELPALELGKPIERELAGDAAHSYSIAVKSGQYLHVIVVQKGIDVVVRLFGPDGKLLAEVDSPNGTEGPEPLMILAKASGTFRLEVRSPDAKAIAGLYQAKLDVLREEQPQDKNRIAAQTLLAEATDLENQKNAESLRKAIAKYEEAILLFHDANEIAKEAESINYVGMIYDSLGEKQKALASYNKSLLLHRSVGDRAGEATNLHNIGTLYDSWGEKQKALDNLNQSIALQDAAGDHESEAATLNSIGNVYRSLGQNQKALDYFNQSLLLQRSKGGDGDASTLNNIGAVYDTLGEKQKALDYYNQSLPLMRSSGDRSGEAYNLSNTGLLYDSLGEKQKALDYYNQALPIVREIGDRRGEAYVLHNIAYVYDLLGEDQKALRFYNQALPLRRIVGDRSGEANTLHNIGLVYKSMGRKSKALGYYNQALPLYRVAGDRRGEAYAINSIGYIYDLLGDKKKALEFYDQTLTLRREVGDRSGEAYTLAAIAKLERDRGNLSEALSRIEETISIVESLRTKISSRELRSSYFATVQGYYAFYIDLLMRLHKREPSAGYDGKALQASERGRARSLLEMLAEANADIKQGVDPVLLERERELQTQLNTSSQSQMKLLAGNYTDDQAKQIAGEIESLTTEFQQLEAKVRQTSPRYAALTQPRPLSLSEIQTQVLDTDTLLLEYSLGEEHSYLWAVTPDSITTYELPGRDEIETLARSAYSLLSDARRWNTQRLSSVERKNRRSTSQSSLRKLSQILLSPVAATLRNKRLVIVADGALQYLPFGALSTPEVSNAREQDRTYHPLIIDHELVSLPSASTLAVLRQEVRDRKPAEKTITVIADPVFESNDVRVNQRINSAVAASSTITPLAEKRELPLGLKRSAAESGLNNSELKIPRLPGTRIEARQILSLVAPEQRKEAFDFAADRQAATSDDLAQYRYVHFATHGFLNSLHPELSGLVFSMLDDKGNARDGFLRAHEIFNLKLTAELVVLSACQTGLGKEIKGEGLVGLTRGFMYAGAPRVVVSMWSVSDAATAELMTRFYRGMLTDNQRPAAALRAAQISLMKEKKWKSPYYWAAFTLQGEWK